MKIREGPAAGFLDLRTIDVLDWIILCFGGCPVHCRMLAASLTFIYYMSSAAPLVVMTNNGSSYFQRFPEDKNLLQLRTTDL